MPIDFQSFDEPQNQSSGTQIDFQPMNKTPEGQKSVSLSNPQNYTPEANLKAFAAGAANTPADLVQGTADLPAYIMNKIPGLNKLFTDELTKEIYKSNKEGTDLLRPQ